MTPAAEALLRRVSGLASLPITPTADRLINAAARRLDDRRSRSQSANLGVPRPCYGLAEDCYRDRPEWRGN